MRSHETYYHWDLIFTVGDTFKFQSSWSLPKDAFIVFVSRNSVSASQENYSQSCIRRSPVGNGTVTVIPRAAAIYRAVVRRFDCVLCIQTLHRSALLDEEHQKISFN